MKINFSEKDFLKLRNFQDTFNRNFGEQTYVGTDSACVFVEYSKELKAMLRPFPLEQHFTFELRALKCEDCPKYQCFLCAKDESNFLCTECGKKREEKKKREREKQQK